MPLVTEGEIMFMNELALFKYGKSIDQMLEEIKNAVAKEEQLLAQQKAKEEHTIVNMYQKLALDVATIANILNVSTDFVQEVLSKNGLV